MARKLAWPSPNNVLCTAGPLRASPAPIAHPVAATDLTEHLVLAEDGSCEAASLFQLRQVHHLLPQRNAQAGLPAAATREGVGPVGQVVEGEVTANRDFHE